MKYGNDVEGTAFSEDPNDLLGSSNWNLKVITDVLHWSDASGEPLS